MIIHGDSLDVLKTLDADSIDSVVTDPPYGLSKEPDVAEVMQHWINGDVYTHKHNGFMGKNWDSFVPGPEYWREVYRVLKPGGHILVFAGTRTCDLMTVALRFAGFEIRDRMVYWAYGSGFPKSSRVNRDQAFCQCALPARNVENTNPLQPHAVHNDTAVDVSDGDVLQSDDQHWSNTSQDFQADYQPDHDSDDERLQVVEFCDQFSTPLPECVQERSRFAALGDDQGDESSRNLSSVQRSGHLSNQDYLRRSESSVDTDAGSLSNKAQSVNSSILMDSAPSVSRKSRTTSQVSALQQVSPLITRCQECRKPVADGLGTALKPANEPIVLARKPLSEKTVAKNVLKYGTGALNIGASRVSSDGEKVDCRIGHSGFPVPLANDARPLVTSIQGRWPSNVVLGCDCGDDEGQIPLVHRETCPSVSLDRQSGEIKTKLPFKKLKETDDRGMYGAGVGATGQKFESQKGLGITLSGASRFFYCAKTSKRERSLGLESGTSNTNPCVKPQKLMEYLIRLITPQGGRCLDPFAGSGSTGVAAVNLGFDFVLIERESEYVTIAEARIAHAKSKKS